MCFDLLWKLEQIMKSLWGSIFLFKKESSINTYPIILWGVWNGLSAIPGRCLKPPSSLCQLWIACPTSLNNKRAFEHPLTYFWDFFVIIFMIWLYTLLISIFIPIPKRDSFGYFYLDFFLLDQSAVILCCVHNWKTILLLILEKLFAESF